MKLPKIPDSDKPRTFRESLYTTTPIVLTVIATVLAGLSSSEMTRSQYFRAMAAQNQAKASDQWGYFQAKRMRAVQARNTLDVLNASASPGRLDPAVLLAASKELADVLAAAKSHAFSGVAPQPPADLPTRAAALDARLRAMLADANHANLLPFASVDTAPPTVKDDAIANPDILQAKQAIEQQQTEKQMAPLLRRISDEDLGVALNTVDGNLNRFDAAMQPMGKTLDELHTIFDEESEIARQWVRQQPPDLAQAAVTSAQTDVSAARQRYAAAYYDGEAGYNEIDGQLCEIQVHMSSLNSDRYRSRSSDFFYGMLAAQAGVLISTLTLAVHRRSIFWSLAAAAGMIAVAFSGYIYLFT